ncbi:MAG: UbiA family prenyltransferase [Chitinophagales bacterium]|nr:UbiA family prenyltransferase [Chitinophagales bacterium]
MESQQTATPPSFFTRAWIYSKEMFPVLIYLPYVIALYCCMNFTSQAVSGHDIIINVYAIVGMISAFFFMLQMRAFDDLKDFEIDKDLFPWRSTPQGLVLKRDIEILAGISFTILVLTNVVFGQKTLWIFAIVMVYTLLTYKWFFAEEYHRKHLFFTMFTHQPLPWMINLYLVYTALASVNPSDPFTINHWILWGIFSLPITAWEVSRKIRAIGNETHYETFSLLLGTRPATLIPFACLLLMGGLAIYMGNALSLGNVFLWLTILLMAYASFFYIRFLWKPTIKNNVLNQTAMVFTSLLFLNLLVHVLMGAKVLVQF